MSNDDFGQWITNELQERGWSQSEAARRGGFSSAMISGVITGQVNPGLDFCRGLAQAFKMPVEEVFRRAGILPTVGELPEGWFELGARLMALSPDQRAAVLQGLLNFLKLAEPRPPVSRRGRA